MFICSESYLYFDIDYLFCVSTYIVLTIMWQDIAATPPSPPPNTAAAFELILNKFIRFFLVFAIILPHWLQI